MRKKMYKKIKEMIEYPNEGILSKEVFKNEKLDATLFCMAKGTEISEHTSTKKAIVYVVEGDGEFILEGKVIKMEEGVIIYLNENAVHSLNAKEDTAFLLILT
jgi:nitric oxide dioxygenase